MLVLLYDMYAIEILVLQVKNIVCCKNQRQTDPLLKIRARVVTHKISHV